MKDSLDIFVIYIVRKNNEQKVNSVLINSMACAAYSSPFLVFDLPHNECYLRCTQLKCFLHSLARRSLNSFPFFIRNVLMDLRGNCLLPLIALHFFMFAILIMKKHCHYRLIIDGMQQNKKKAITIKKGLCLANFYCERFYIRKIC